VAKVWSDSVNKYPRYLANNVYPGRTHKQMDRRMHEHYENIMLTATTLEEEKEDSAQTARSIAWELIPSAAL